MSYSNPTVNDFKNFFIRDFPYGIDPAVSIIDQDITNAFAESQTTLNPGLFSNQANYTLGALLLAAHFLVVSIQSSSQGISGQYAWQQNSKSVGNVSEGLAIPQRILDNPELSMISKTNYGARYLLMILPKLSGQIFSACGRTRA